MASMVSRMLDFADEFIDTHPRSSAAKRRAVSTAYYAAFHEIVGVCADEFLPDEDINSVLYERVYRSIDHGTLKRLFQPSGPLGKEKALSEIGRLLVPLQSARITADYAPPQPNVFELQKARSYVLQAREIVERLKVLNGRDRRMLAVSLLFKERPKD